MDAIDAAVEQQDNARLTAQHWTVVQINVDNVFTGRTINFMLLAVRLARHPASSFGGISNPAKHGVEQRLVGPIVPAADETVRTRRHEQPSGGKPSMNSPVRRIVTGHDADGNSIVLTDGIATNIKEMGTTQIVLTELWETTTAPASNAGVADAAARPAQLEPPPNGTVLRFVEFPPDEVWLNNSDTAAAFASIGGGDTHDPTGRAFNHRTKTLDYIIVMKGEITCVLDKEEAHLKAGDVLIQRGTNHSWSVRGKEPCTLCAILVSAEPL